MVLFSRVYSLAAIVAWFLSMSASAQPDVLRRFNGPDLLSRCGGPGERCCRPRGALSGSASSEQLVNCKSGLGCDLVSETCQAPCGAAGQVCCDGPETRAPRWTSDGKVYVPTGPMVREMCADSACVPETRRCQANCGLRAEDACCGPQPGIAQASCLSPSLYCDFTPDSHFERGTCRACGLEGQPGCPRGRACADKLVEDPNGTCVACGEVGQRVCENYPRCRGESAPHPATGATCVPAGRVNQPCLSDGTCIYSVCNPKRICEACGFPHLPCCRFRANSCLIGQCGGGFCYSCGHIGERPCGNNQCFTGKVYDNGICGYESEGSQPPHGGSGGSQPKCCFVPTSDSSGRIGAMHTCGPQCP